MPFKKSLTILFLFLSVFASSIQNLFSQAPTSENEQRIKAYLEKFPKSDADDNGILTLQELLTHMRKTREGREKSNNDDPLKPSSDRGLYFAEIRFSKSARYASTRENS